MPSVMMAAGAVRLTTSIGETPAMPESQDQAARERRGHAAETGGDHGEVAPDRRSSCRILRREA